MKDRDLMLMAVHAIRGIKKEDITEFQKYVMVELWKHLYDPPTKITREDIKKMSEDIKKESEMGLKLYKEFESKLMGKSK